ncbi:MAG: hypothetical protein C4343_03705 [Chloroflexota bacterium]
MVARPLRGGPASPGHRRRAAGPVPLRIGGPHRRRSFRPFGDDRRAAASGDPRRPTADGPGPGPRASCPAARLADPALFAGVRPFQRGDPRRRIHERATARLGRPVSKRFEPSAVRDVVVVLDVQTLPGPVWLLQWDDELVEALAVAAGSLARRVLDDGSACGLAVNAWTYQPDRIGFVPPRAGPGQLARILDLLGRMSPVPSMPYSRMLATLTRRIPAGALVVTMSGRDPSELGPGLRRLRAGGFELLHVAVGQDASAYAAKVRHLGIPARVAELAPDWRTCDVVALAG